MSDYPHRLAIPTRWQDNDVYGHVNNVEYYAFFDTVINAYLIREGGLDIHSGEVIGLCAESHCEFRAPLWRRSACLHLLIDPATRCRTRRHDLKNSWK